MFNFSTSNIGKEALSNILILRMEGLILRVRIVIYTTLIVSLTSFPFICSLTIFLLELAHILTYTYYAIRYKYAMNWFLMVSKINLGLSILSLSGSATIINIQYRNAMSYQNHISPVIQYTCIFLLIFSLAVEVLVLVLTVILKIGSMVKKRFTKKKEKKVEKKKSLFYGMWVKINPETEAIVEQEE